MMNPDAWIIEELNDKGEVIWSSIMPIRPKELSWFRDLPSKKHTITITPLYADTSKSETFSGIKSYKESTQRLVEANIGL